jgi:signal transduction histidine kinase
MNGVNGFVNARWPFGRAADLVVAVPERALGDDVVARTENRLTRIVVFVRVGTAPFMYLPLLGWEQLRHPVLALGVGLAASVEAGLFAGRAYRHGRLTDIPGLVWADVLFCVLLMLVGSQAAAPDQRNAIMTELVPFSLASSACVGLGLGRRAGAVAAVAGLMVAWAVAVLPDVTQKLASDLLGFALWYAVTLLTAGEMRRLSRATAHAQREVVEREKEAERGRQREVAHREIHDYLLPIIEFVAAGEPVTASIVAAARQGASRARRLITDPRVVEGPSFAALMDDACATFAAVGLDVVPVFLIHSEPPPIVAEAIAAAAREALHNVQKHSRSRETVAFFVESSDEGVKVVVHDRGVGFDPDGVAAGGGFSGTFQTIRRHGGTCHVDSGHGRGTKVTIEWLPPDDHRDNHAE